MELKRLAIDMDLSAIAIHEAIIQLGGDNIRLICGSDYTHHIVLESIFHDRGKLDIPFETSYALDGDAWMIVSTNGLLYSPGA